MTPDELMRTAFHRVTGGHARVPAGVEGTCAQKKGPDTMIDFVYMSAAASSFIQSLEVVRSVPWKPHLGLALSLRASGQTLRT
eukprot:7682155-Pyramimonas_sp.AAC.1